LAAGPEPQPDRMYRFGPFELSEAELRKNGERIKLQEQPYLVLLHLVTNAARIVTREELQQKLWPADTFVDFDVGLNSAVRKLRQALGDDADHPRYIETLAKRGYRFIAAVTETSLDPPLPAPEPLLVPATENKVLPEPPPPADRRKQVIVAAISALVLAALGVLALRFSGSATPHFIVEERITSNPEENPVIGAVISPDGKYLAYADSTGVYFREIDNGETHPLPTPKGKDWVPTSWYPDSTHLILSSWSANFTGPEWFAPDAHPSIWTVSILGGNPQKMVEDATEGIISPDGSQIAYLRGGAPAYPRQIWLAQIAGDNPMQVPASTTPVIVSSIAWSPHGKRVAYVRAYTESPTLNLWALETLDVRTHRAMILKVSSQFSGALCWAPDGRVLYAHATPNSEERDIFGVFAQPVNENTGATEGKDVQLTDGPGVIGGMSVSTERSRLALWRVRANGETFISEIDPQSQKLQPMRRLTLDQNTNVVSAWTSDSRFVLFNSNRTGGFKVYRQALDQTVPELLVDGHRTGIIRLSPDGTHLLFTVDNSLLDGENPGHPKPAAVMRVPVEGGSPQTLFQLPRIGDIQCARSPSKLCLLDTWSPDGIFSFDPDTGQRQPASLGGKFDREEWSLSPDGSTLALILKDRRLTFIDLSTKKAHDVTVGEWKQLYAVDWAPDSKSVYIPSRRPSGEYVLLRVEPNGASRVVLEGGKTPRYQWAIPSPDGKHVAVQATTGENNVWMIEHF
jgi:DNA-binding winged helix-turn-helix (wHTH) protein/Tol biopolymer transport system component